MKKLFLGAVTVMIAASPALAGHNRGPSWRSDASSDPPPVMGKTFGAYPYGPLQYVNPYPAPWEKADTLSPRTKRDVHKR
jgi:hypothetical protein